MRWQMKCHSTRRRRVEWNISCFTENENICFIARMINIHYLSYVTYTKIQNFKKKIYTKNHWKRFQLKENIKQAARPILRGRYYANDCVTLNARTASVAFAPRRVSHVVFLISLVLEHTSKDCIGNTEHYNINVNDECNSKINNCCTLADPTECNRMFCHLIL